MGASDLQPVAHEKHNRYRVGVGSGRSHVGQA